MRHRKKPRDSCSDDVDCVWSGARSNVRSGVGVCFCVSVCVHACVCLSYSFSSSLFIGSNYAVALIVIQPAVGELRTRTEEGERVRCGVRCRKIMSERERERDTGRGNERFV